jgi:hypothetical protein
VALTEVDVLYVAPEPFLQLMREQPELCGEATTMLGREVTFIQSALSARRKQAAIRKTAPEQGMLVG